MTAWRRGLDLGLKWASFACFALAFAAIVVLVWAPLDWVLQLIVSLGVAGFGLWACAGVLHELLRRGQ